MWDHNSSATIWYHYGCATNVSQSKREIHHNLTCTSVFLTTLIVLFALFFLGGEIIHNFALAMIIGVIIGTFSSIFVATPIVLAARTRG